MGWTYVREDLCKYLPDYPTYVWNSLASAHSILLPTSAYLCGHMGGHHVEYTLVYIDGHMSQNCYVHFCILYIKCTNVYKLSAHVCILNV